MNVKEIKRKSINRIVARENTQNVEHMVAFKSWVEKGYNQGYKDAVAYLEKKYVTAYVNRHKKKRIIDGIH